MHMDWMCHKHLGQVLRIEGLTAPPNGQWSEADFLRELRENNCAGAVVLNGNNVIAFVVYRILSNRIHVMHMAVSPQLHSQQWVEVGTLIVEELKEKLRPGKRNSITFIVRESALALQKLLSFPNGFTATKVLRQHFIDTDEDGYIFEFSLPTQVVAGSKLKKSENNDFD